MRELSLFTGAGGGVLGTTLLGWTHIGYVEWDDYCQRLLRQRMEDGYIETAPIFGDIRAFISEGYARSYQGLADVITAGFPCQPFSVAGKQGGEDDPRNMWPATIECIRIIRPRYALLENVPGLLNSRQILTLKFVQKVRQLNLFGAGSKDTLAGHVIRGIERIAIRGYFGRILGDLAESGYDARWRVLSAAEVGAPHKRDRLWIMANARHDVRDNNEVTKDTGQTISDSSEGSPTSRQPTGPDIGDRGLEDMADTHSERQQQPQGVIGEVRGRSGNGGEDVADTLSQQDNKERSASEFRRHALGRNTEASQCKDRKADTNGFSGCSQDVADTNEQRLSESTRTGVKSFRGQKEASARCHFSRGSSAQGGYWTVEPDVGRVANGVANRVDRLKAIGNGQVPAVVAAAWELLTSEDYE